MNTLQQAREQIDSIDREMARLFEQRMDAVQSVLRYKIENNLPIRDESRENEVVEKNLSYVQNPAYVALYQEYLRNLLTLSCQFQAEQMGQDRVACPGLEGSYSHVALQRLFPQSQALYYSTWSDVFDAVEKGEANAGIIPFEDSHMGDIAAVLDLCWNHNLYISQVYDLPVVNSLLALPNATLWGIREVYSHPQTLHQSETFLKTMEFSAHPTPSTAQAAQLVAQSHNLSFAAIASPEAAVTYGLVELANGISSDDSRQVHFLVMSRTCPTRGNHFCLLFTLDNQPGMLAQIVQEIGRWGFNMETIQSHPRPGMPYSYYFYAELAGTLQQAESLVAALRDMCQTVRLLGVYQR